jgi:hypothetical protein
VQHRCSRLRRYVRRKLQQRGSPALDQVTGNEKGGIVALSEHSKTRVDSL